MRIPTALGCICLLGLTVAAGCGGSTSADRAAPADPVGSEAADWTRYEVPGADLTVSFPSGWTRSTVQLMPMLADPREVVALGTSELLPGGDNCAHMPENAIEGMGPTDAVVVLEERLEDFGEGSPSAGFPERPLHFGPDDGYTSEAFDCLDRPKAFSDRLISFSDSSRRFHAYVAFGNEAPPATREEAWAILDRLEIEPRSGT